MKRFILTLSVLVIVFMLIMHNVTAQNEKLGIGLQYQAFTYGLSAKYNIDINSSVQATINPISANSLNMNFYGARYYYHFPQEDSPLKPYLFGGAGLITFSYKLSALSNGILKDYSDSFFGYSAGGGLAFKIVEKLEGSADIGYGKIDISNGIGVSSATLGVGLHYYIN